jgi:RNA polymerase sigma factor (sigma-70 family)
MPTARTSPVIHQLRRAALLGDVMSMTDGELLDCFITRRDDAAFEALLRRHGPMVLNLCRRMIGNFQDAEDAFQAAFLVLARKAAVVVPREGVGNWLYGVAYRTARRAKAVSARHHAREKQVKDMPHRAIEPAHGLEDVELVLDEELNRLPAKYRLPVVLCELEGRSRKEVARQLKLPEGTLSSRLATARRMLARRLTRRGVALGTGAMAAALSQSTAGACLSKPLILGTMQAVSAFTMANTLPGLGGLGGAVSAPVVALAEGVLKSMMLTKLKTTATIFLLLACAGIGAGLLAQSRALTKEVPKAKEAQKPTALGDITPLSMRIQKELRQMRGTWSRTETEEIIENGRQLPPREKKVTYVLADDKLIRLGDDGLIDETLTLKLDPTASPKAVDMISLQYGTLWGIYELDGDSLKIAYSTDEDKRPTKFSSSDLEFKRVSRTPAKTSPRFVNAPGCFWMIEPSAPSPLFATLGIVFTHEKDREGATLITLASAGSGIDNPEYRPVLLDAGKTRYLPELDVGGSSGGRHGVVASLNRWRMDPKILPADKVVGLGIEAVTPEAHRIAATLALEQAKKDHIEVLSWPEPARPYAFTLTTLDGRTIRSEDLKGKVVLLDCWASL